MTNIAGVFAAGECDRSSLRPAVNRSPGMAVARYRCERWLESQGEEVGVENWNDTCTLERKLHG